MLKRMAASSTSKLYYLGKQKKDDVFWYTEGQCHIEIFRPHTEIVSCF